MRVSTMQLNNTMQYNMSTTTASMNKTLIQLATGKRIQAPSDDVLASNQIRGLQDQLSQLGTWEKNIGSAENSLSLAETVVSDMTNVMNRVRDLVLASGSGAIEPYQQGDEEPVQPLPPEDGSDNDLGANLQEIEMLMQTLFDLANTKGASGEYIFAGTQGDRPVIVETEDGFEIHGSDGAREIQISDSQSSILGVVAKDIFGEGDDNIFNVMSEFLAVASDPETSQEDFDQLMADTLNAIDDTLAGMNKALTSIGAAMNTLDMASASNGDMQMYNELLVGSLENLDYASAITEFSMQQVQMQASQKAYAMVGSTSLFDYV